MSEYKSKLLAEGGLPENFFESLKDLVNIDEQIFRKILVVWPPETQGVTPDVRQKLISLGKSSGVSLQVAASAIAAASLIADLCEENADKCDDIIDDLQTGKYISLEDRPSVANKLKLYSELLDPKLKVAYIADRYFKDTFPYISHIHTRISSFVTFENEYEIDTDQPESYKPIISRSEPVAFVQIDINQYGKKHMLGFALREKHLSELINRLRLAESQLRTAKEKHS